MSTVQFTAILNAAPTQVPYTAPLSLQNIFACTPWDFPADQYLGLWDSVAAPAGPPAIWLPIGAADVPNLTPLGRPPPAIGYRFANGLWVAFSSAPMVYAAPDAAVSGQVWINLMELAT